MRLLICAGGTGGGVYPAMAVLQALQPAPEQSTGRAPADPAHLSAAPAQPSPSAADPQVLWVGSAGGMEAEIVKRAGVTYTEIPAAGIHGVGLSRLPGNLVMLARGYRRARSILHSFQPDALFFTGGFVAAPMALAGRGIPSLVFTPDIEPGLALRFMARFAESIAVSAEESRSYYPPQAPVTVTGYPVRRDLLRWERREARRALGLSDDLPVLLVFGGSKGARSINRALSAVLTELLQLCRVVHITGALDWPEAQARRAALAETLPAAELARYHAFPYLHDEMGAAFAAADLVVCRAGASTLGELPAFRLPAILVPYPHAWRYQRINAEHLSRRGAAQIIEDAELPEQLLPAVSALLRDEQRLEAMRRAAGELARPNAADSIADLLRRQAQTRKDVVA